MAKEKLYNGRVRQTAADFDPPASPTALNMRLLIPNEIWVVGSPARGGFSLIEDPPSFWRTRGAKIPPTDKVVRDFPFMAYFLYILYSDSGDRYYIGSSENPVRRIEYHNTIENGFTSRYRPWNLVFTKAFNDKKSAQTAERKVKSWKRRIMINKLITGEIDI